VTKTAVKAQVHTLILAAGESRRFQGCKQLALFRGQTLLSRVVALAESVTPGAVHLVLGANAKHIRSESHALFQRTELSTHFHEQWSEGMGSSLAAGMASLPKPADAVLVLLVDQINLSVEDLQLMIAAWVSTPHNLRDTQIICADYGPTLGVPALFPAHYFAELMQLRGDRGAKKIISRYASNTLALPMESAKIDIDTVEQLDREHSR